MEWFASNIMQGLGAQNSLERERVAIWKQRLPPLLPLWLVKGKSPPTVIGDPPEVQWALGLREPSMSRSPAEFLALDTVSFPRYAYSQISLRWVSSGNLLLLPGWPDFSVAGGCSVAGFLIAGMFSSSRKVHWKIFSGFFLLRGCRPTC